MAGDSDAMDRVGISSIVHTCELSAREQVELDGLRKTQI